MISNAVLRQGARYLILANTLMMITSLQSVSRSRICSRFGISIAFLTFFPTSSYNLTRETHHVIANET